MSGRILRDNVFMAERLDDRFEDFVDYRLYYNTKLGLLFMFFFLSYSSLDLYILVKITEKS